MCQEQPRAHLLRQRPQIGIRPGWQHISVQTGFGAVVIPRQPKPITIDGTFAFTRGLRLMDQRVTWLCDQRLNKDR